jgi:hypothetical protein
VDVNRSEFQALSQIRIKEAKALLWAGLADGTYYLAGYSVECALKARIAKATKLHEFPDKRKVDSSHTHDLTELVRIAILKESLSERAEQDSDFGNNWTLVKDWSEQSRYRRYNKENARALVDAVELMQSIREATE